MTQFDELFKGTIISYVATEKPQTDWIIVAKNV